MARTDETEPGERLRTLLRTRFGAVAIVFLLLQGMHLLEHTVQVIQLRFLHLAKDQAHGVLSSFDNEWVHFLWNLGVFVVLVALVHLRPGRVLKLAMLLSGVHLIEHGVLLRQLLSSGVPGSGIFATGGLLFGPDGWIPRPELHLLYNGVEFLPVLAIVLGLVLRAPDTRRTLGRHAPSGRERGRVGRWVDGYAAGVLVLTVTIVLVAGSAVLPPLPDAGVRFQDVSARSGLNVGRPAQTGAPTPGGDVAAADYDGDGRLDLYVTSTLGPSRLLHNNGDGTFTDVAKAAGVANLGGKSQGACWGDYNNDGLPDLFVTNQISGRNTLFRNNGDGTFADVTDASGLASTDPVLSHGRGCAWGDFDKDGRLDLAVVRFQGQLPQELGPLEQMTSSARAQVLRPISLYRADAAADGHFTDIAASLGDLTRFPSNVNGMGVRPLFFDADDDGWPDLYLVNDFGTENYPNVLFHNNGRPTGTGTGRGWSFTDVSTESGLGVAIYGMGAAVGDFDGDGKLDLYLSNIGSAQLLHNEGGGHFTNVADAARAALGTDAADHPSISWGVAFLDYDNDGLPDLYRTDGPLSPGESGNMSAESNAERMRPQTSHLLRNTGGRFQEVSRSAGVAYTGRGRAVLPLDLRGGGQTDLLLMDLDETLTLYENGGSANHWLEITLVGTKSNRNGLGARISLSAGGRTQLHETGTGFGYMSGSLLPEHFGVGSAGRIETLTVRWPSGVVQTLRDVAVDQKLTLTEPATGN